MNFTKLFYALSFFALLLSPITSIASSDNHHEHEELPYEDVLAAMAVASTQYWAIVGNVNNLKAVSAKRNGDTVKTSILYADSASTKYERDCTFTEALTTCNSERAIEGHVHEESFEDYYTFMEIAPKDLKKDNDQLLRPGMEAGFVLDHVTGVKVFKIPNALPGNYFARVFFTKTDGTHNNAILSCHYANHGHHSDNANHDDHDAIEVDCHFIRVNMPHPAEPM